MPVRSEPLRRPPRACRPPAFTPSRFVRLLRLERFVLAAVVFLLFAVRASAQDLPRYVEGPEADWRTLTTEHFRVHYPAHSEAWARHAVARLESIREVVAEEVGFTPTEVVDVLVSDPTASANGFALPFLGWPRMVLWTTPPGPESVVGHYRDWAELLLVHEDTHLVHLLRPSRNPWRRAMVRLGVPLGPLAAAPRWVSEGYATVIEGRLTGAGRPNADLRAAVLRRWAQAGKLPSYGRLASDRGSYLGMSMAYLAGSAYLEWLEARAGEGALRDLWARMTARRARSFEAAFEGVFADSPADLWDRFRAELAWSALEVEQRVAGEDGGAAPGWVEGDVWLDLAWATGAPAVSPDGSRFALVLRHRDDPAELAVYETEVDREALDEREERRREIAAADPEDVPAVDTGPPPRRRLHTLPTLDGAAPSQPRWLPDGSGGAGALLLVRYLPDADGILHPDLFRWTLGAEAGAPGTLERLTAGADLRDADPAPDGTWAAAVRSRHGTAQLVRVGLPGGAVEAITEPTVEAVYDAPRVSPDGGRLVYARHTAGAWALVVRDLATGAEEALPLPPAATVASPAWGRGDDGGTVYAVVGSGGFIDVFAFRPEGEGWTAERVTRTRGAAFAPAPAPAVGEEPAGVFYLSLEPDGLDLRRLAGASGAEDRGAGAAAAQNPGDEGGGVEVAGAVRSAAEAEDAGTKGGSVDDHGAGSAGIQDPGDEGGAVDVAGVEARGIDAPYGEAGGVEAPPGGEPPLAEGLPFAAPSRLEDLAPVVRPAPPEAPVTFSVAELPPGEPSGVQRLEVAWLSGGAWGADAWSAEMGVRAGDLLGRLDVVATGSWAADGAPAGGALAAAWRRLPVALSFHAAVVDEEPSRQRRSAAGDALGVAAGALDVERRGVELAADWDRLAGGGPLRLAGGGWVGEAQPRGGAAVDERSLFAEGSWAPWTGRGRWSARLGLEGRLDAGDSGGDGWRRARGRLRLAVRRDDLALAAAWERGEAGGDAVEPLPAASPAAGNAPPFAVAAPWQLFQVGGLPSSLHASSLAAPRLAVPALPAAALAGQEVEAQRVELRTDLLPLPLFWSRYRVESEGAGGSGWRSLAGVEWRGSLGPVPLVRLPALDFAVGAAQLLDGPDEGGREAWLAVTWRP